MSRHPHRLPDPFEMDDAAYLLGALSPHERALYEQHLQTCDACSRSVTELAGMPGVLRRLPLEVVQSMDEPVDPDDVAGDEPPPPSVLAGLLDRAELEDHRARGTRRLRWITAATVAAAALVVAVLAFVDLGRPEQPVAAPPPATELELEPLTRTTLTATVSLRDVAWGTKIQVECAYPAQSGSDPYASAPEYSLVVHDISGASEQVATWNAVAGRSLTIDAATALRGFRIASVEIRSQDGTPILSAEA